MEDKVEKKKGRRVTKNSSGLTTRSEESPLEIALRKSQKEQRKLDRKKAKEDKELERVLELSKRDMGRIESASHLLKLKSSSPPSPPVMTLLRRQEEYSEGKERIRERRVCPFSGIPECDSDKEEKDTDPNHPSNLLLLGTAQEVSPTPLDNLTINTLMENANALGLDFEHNNSSSRTDNAEDTDDSTESDDDGISVHLESPVAPIPVARRQKLLNECEFQYHFNETMKRYANESSTPSMVKEKGQTVPPVLPTVDEPLSSPNLKLGVDSKKRSPSLSETERLLLHSSSELEDLSGSSDHGKGEAHISSSDTTSSTNSVVMTQNMCDALSEGADTWADEDDVLRAMASLSLSASKVTISRKTLANMFFKARPPACEMKQLLAAQEQSFDLARKDLEKRLLEVRASETKKIKKPRQELDQLIVDYEEKLRVLNLRIQASEVFQNENTDVTAQMEVALDDALSENRSLKDQIKNLKGILNDMFLHGNMPDSSKGKGELKIKPSPSPASSSSCVEPSPRSCSSASESSLASPLNDSRLKEKRTRSPPTNKEKRNRSPPTKVEKDFDFKKPRPRCPLHSAWHKEGNMAATDFLNRGPIRQFLITKTKDELENFLPRIMKAQDDFRDMFPPFFDSDSSLSIQSRNEERHLKFASLQLELMIPTHSQGRKFALSFYYGKILGDIKDILKSREQFIIVPNDHRKIREYIQFLGEDHPDVKDFRIAEGNSKHLQKETPHFCESFRVQFMSLLERDAVLPPWINKSLFMRIRGQDQSDKVACNLLYDQARIIYMDYHYFLYLHCIINFYSSARARSAKTFFARKPGNNTNGGGPQGRN